MEKKNLVNIYVEIYIRTVENVPITCIICVTVISKNLVTGISKHLVTGISKHLVTGISIEENKVHTTIIFASFVC
jgi:hypothetical protein